MKKTFLPFALALVALGGAACRGPRGHAGAPGPQGPPGPPGVPSGGAPRIDDISPSVGSKRSLVFVLGSNFSSVMVENEVRFGSLAGDVVYASPTELHVRTPVGLAVGAAPITVSVHQQTSNSAAFEFAASGAVVPDAPLGSPSAPGAGLELVDGRILVPDAADAAILEILADGTVDVLVADPQLAGARRLAQSPSGAVFVFSPTNEGIFSVDPATGALYVEHFGAPYASGSFDAMGNLYAIPASRDRVDLFSSAGTTTTSWGTFAVGDVANDVQVLGTTVFAAVDGASPGVRTFGAGGGAATPVTTGGVTSIRCLAADGARLIAGGVFTATSGVEGLVDVATDGTISLYAAGAIARVDGVVKLQSGDALVGDGAAHGVFDVSPTTIAVRAGGMMGAHASLRPGAGAIVSAVYNGSLVPGWLVESFQDGRTRVRAQGFFGGIAAEDATHVRALRRDLKDVVSVDLVAGTTTPVFSVAGQFAAPNGLTRDANGNHYVSGNGVIARYDTAGALLAATFASVPSVESITVDGTVMYAAQPTLGEASRVVLADGSVQPWLRASTGVQAPSSFYRSADDATMRLFLVDAVAGATWLIDTYGFVSPFDLNTPKAGSVSQYPDGTIVVTGAGGRMLRTP